ncbi:MAG: hypothetical protein MUO62_19080, partial [Anaerolineales bacterium]|nr:hypothetical protein [Anaerolineales bacterium]
MIQKIIYLMCTQHSHWAIDPTSLKNRVPEATHVDVDRDLAPLDFVLLIHLEELGPRPQDFWDETQVELVIGNFNPKL